MVRHVLADGTELTSIEGRVIPPTGRTEAVYRLVAEFLINSRRGRTADRRADIHALERSV